jgi:hypothetical protein
VIYPKIYPVACPDRTCQATVGEPCTSRDGLMHTARSQMFVEHIHQRATEARSVQALFQSPPKHRSKEF